MVAVWRLYTRGRWENSQVQAGSKQKSNQVQAMVLAGSKKGGSQVRAWGQKLATIKRLIKSILDYNGQVISSIIVLFTQFQRLKPKYSISHRRCLANFWEPWKS